MTTGDLAPLPPLAAPADEARNRGQPTNGGWLALAVTLAIQIFVALAAAAPAVLAPKIARDFGVDPKLVGVFVALVYGGSMISSLLSGGFIERHGSIRVSQVGVLLCAAGIGCMAAVPGALVPLLAVVAVIVGLGYGPITPASSQLLARTARPDRMAVTFSIKQTGVPAGAALAGAILPSLALGVGWRTTLLAVAFVGVFTAIAAERTRTVLDGDVGTVQRFSLARVLLPLRLVFAHRPLRQLAITGTVYAVTQNCLLSFLVIHLTETLGYSLVAAGMALTVATLAGVVGRIGWGGIADAYVTPRTLLGALGLAAGTSAFAVAVFAPSWPLLVVLFVCAIFGATAVGWNGVQLAEIARHAPSGQAAAVTGACGFLLCFGLVLGPPTFALLAAMTGGYRASFGVFGFFSFGCGLWLVLTRRR